ncbi:MAG: YifB family Mg chelatase-like AAA ATPase [Anaerolineae bacterium]|mgnify:CR=1 FL=1|nr:YifB family Mg chelatase-like AAA ATPase [Anaerolineae bacterium]MBN8617489.1 YifB family Mg chelatase-like AAA ATPase [Anaerolineae bacterium]
MLAIVNACALLGLEGRIIEVEVDFNPRVGVPSFNIVGLPDSAVKESRERVRAAIKNARLQFPNKAYVVNLSPADMPKHGPAYDLAIAVGVLAATDQVPLDSIADSLFLGELSLDGSVRHIKGIMPMVYTAFERGISRVYVAAEDAPQAGLITGVQIIPVESLGHLVEHLYGLQPIPPYTPPPLNIEAGLIPEGIVDFADIKGQQHSKRALEIAAGGNHNILFSGSPGVGKTLLARAMPGILPRLTLEEALEVTRIYSVADMLRGDHPLVQSRPFRAPHHTISQAGLVGGGSIPKPGEISLAHRGVLFVDEIVEMSSKTLEVLRQPIEDKIVTISRAQGTMTFPANFLLVGAMNPCPCGYYGDTARACTCSPTMIARYQGRLSGPLLDRIDLHVDVPRVEYDKLMTADRAESSAAVRERVEQARERQRQRFAGRAGLYANADMGVSEIQQLCILSTEARQLLEVSTKRLQLSARSYHRIIKLSRTIADLDGSHHIEIAHVAEAIQYRPRQSSH